MKKKTLQRPHLTVVSPDGTAGPSRRKLPGTGTKLRKTILDEYELETGGVAMLDQAVSALNRLDDVAAAINRSGGLMVHGKPHPLMRTEMSLRGLAYRCLRSLGLDLEPIADVGAPLNGFCGVGPDDDDDED